LQTHQLNADGFLGSLAVKIKGSSLLFAINQQQMKIFVMVKFLAVSSTIGH